MIEEVLHPHQDAEFEATEQGAEGLDERYPMPPTGIIQSCPKCGAAPETLQVEWHEGGRLDGPCGGRFGWPEVMYLGEHVCKTCRTCRFGWPERVVHAGV